MKKINLNFKSIVRSKARWLLTLIAIFTLGVGQMWGYAITVYVIPKAIWGNDWTEGSSKVKIWWKFGATSTAVYMSKTVWTYDGDCIYAYTVNDLSSDGLDFLEFQRFSSADVYENKHSVYSSWKEASNFGGKIFKGEWSGGDPTWHTFGRDITIYGVPETMDGSKWVEGSHTLYANFKVGDSEWKKQQMTKTSDTYAGNPIYKCTMLIKYNVIKVVEFIYNDGSDKSLYSYTPGSQHSTDDIDGKIFRGWINSSHKWSTYEVDHTIAAGSTIVWDLGGNNQSWSNVYLYKTVNSSTADPAATNDGFSKLGSSTQYSKTYSSAVNYIGAWLFRNNTANWNDHTQTTNIDSNVSGLTLYTYCNTESSNKLDWQVTTGAKKGTSGRTIYFDDTNTNWKDHEKENREIYFNYGVDWDGGGYHRKIDFAVEKVPGTANLYKLKASSSDATNTGATNSSGQFDHDIYFQKWYVSKYYGYTNHNPITDSHVLERTEIYTDAITSNDFTLIPTTKQAGGSGTDGSPYIWNTTQKTGHTWNAAITAPSNGTITIDYTDESDEDQSFNSGNANVAHTCILTITAEAANGYDDPANVSVNSGTLSNGGNYTIRENITVSATFSPHTYNITLNAGDHGSAAGSATVDFDATSLNSVTHVEANAGYQLIGYYDAETKVLNANGSFADTNVDGYITSGKWSKYDADATLTAKFSPVTLTFNVDENGYWNTAANWTPACVPTIDHPVVLEKKVQVNVNSAQAKSVRIHHYGDYTGMLVVKEKAGLLVAEDIKAKHAADKAYEATTDEDLQIRTSDEGNGGLITGNACVGNEAEYVFYAKACKYIWSEHAYYINQYVGIPFASMEAYELYGFNIFVYDDAADDWRTPGSASMTPWTTYNMISRYTDNWPYYFIKGELNLPGKSGTVELECGSRYSGGTGTADKDNIYFDNGGDHMFANSWTAPISIGAFTASDFSDLDEDGEADIAQTIYIFNAGFEGAGEGKDLGSYAGTWSSFPISSSTYMARAVIPATQAFLVSSKMANATMTLNYEKHVYNPAKARDSICTYPTRAPRRTKMNDDPNVLRIIVIGNDVEADQLYVLERGDFSFGYDDSWDGNKISSLSFVPQIYAVNGEHKMAVNAIPDMEGMKIGFKAGKNANEYTFSFEYADDAETLYLYDTDTQAYTQITSEATYSFTTSDTKEHERFVITRKAPQIVTGFEETIIKSNARKQMIDGILYIIRDGRMYNAEGALVK